MLKVKSENIFQVQKFFRDLLGAWR